MAEVTVYATAYCPYCHAAKTLLAEMEIPFTEIDLTGKPRERDELSRLTDGRKTVPQIFIDDQCIGGYDELCVLARSGELAARLGSS